MRYPFVITAIDPGKKGSATKLQILGGTENIQPAAQLLNVISFAGDKDWEITLLNLLTRCKRSDVVAMENVHSKRYQGVKSMFTFGAYKGDARTTVKFAGHEVHWVEQTVWPRIVGLKGSDDRKKRKAEQDAKAIELYPELANIKGDIYASALIATAVAIDLCPDFRSAYMQQYAPPTVAVTPEQIEYQQRLNWMLRRTQNMTDEQARNYRGVTFEDLI